jgi:Lectin C-type domain
MPRSLPAIALVSAIACAACGDVTLKDPDVPAVDARADLPDAREGMPDAGADVPDARPVSTPDARVPDAGEPGLPCIGGDAQRVDPDTGACYMLFTTPRTWNEAVFICASLGSNTHLAALTSVDEHQIVVDLTAGLLDVWLGATDSSFEGQFVWITGDLMDFSVWAAGEPNNGGTNGEDCAGLINSGARAGFWDDRVCETAYPHVCERE